MALKHIVLKTVTKNSFKFSLFYDNYCWFKNLLLPDTELKILSFFIKSENNILI